MGLGGGLGDGGGWTGGGVGSLGGGVGSLGGGGVGSRGGGGVGGGGGGGSGGGVCLIGGSFLGAGGDCGGGRTFLCGAGDSGGITIWGKEGKRKQQTEERKQMTYKNRGQNEEKEMVIETKLLFKVTGKDNFYGNVMKHHIHLIFAC